ncbi:hypothetical protein [Marinobacterium jannaschii]|uniref:hypothetical protein n=1 Tax=Marinobacterium jannaschii TaxID=64970 RepID=UPI00047F9A9D|nr:hypothetical protein [Marinobacterium jannaschii]
MSLETEMAALQQAIAGNTAANQALADQVAGWLGAADQKISEATQAVPAAVSGLSEIYRYVSLAGNDSGAGTASEPHRTIKHAIESCPLTSRVIVVLVDGDETNKHVIGETIQVSSRIIEIRPNGAHLHLADALAVVFQTKPGGVVYFSDHGGDAGTIHLGTDKLFVSAGGPTTVHLGGYDATTFRINDAATLKVLQTNYAGSARGLSVLTMSRVNCKNADGSAAAVGAVVGWNPSLAGSALIDLWQCDMGTDYKDAVDPAMVATLVGALKVASV